MEREGSPLLLAASAPRSSEPLPKFMYVLTVFSAIGGFLFGYDTVRAALPCTVWRMLKTIHLLLARRRRRR